MPSRYDPFFKYFKCVTSLHNFFDISCHQLPCILYQFIQWTLLPELGSHTIDKSSRTFQRQGLFFRRRDLTGGTLRSSFRGHFSGQPLWTLPQEDTNTHPLLRMLNSEWSLSLFGSAFPMSQSVTSFSQSLTHSQYCHTLFHLKYDPLMENPTKGYKCKSYLIVFVIYMNSQPHQYTVRLGVTLINVQKVIVALKIASSDAWNVLSFNLPLLLITSI